MSESQSKSTSEPSPVADRPGPARVFVASDHAGRTLRAHVVRRLADRGVAVVDLGPVDEEPVDYPVPARAVADRIRADPLARGVLVCGSGIGMSIAANKIPGIRAAVCTHEWQARMGRAHNDLNVLCVGERITGPDLADALVDAFLRTPFEGGRHQRRLDAIARLEQIRDDAPSA